MKKLLLLALVLFIGRLAHAQDLRCNISVNASQIQGTILIKRKSDDLTINLTPNKDIAAELGKMKTGNQVLVGFALETNEEEQNSFKKLKSKNLDFIVLNSLRDKGAGFHHDTNKISIIFKDGEIEHFDLKSKVEVAQDIVNQVVRFL